MGVEWGGRDERPRKKKTKWLGGDPAKGYASVGQMPGAPGINDEAIFAAQRERERRTLNQQQFGPDEG